VDLPLVRTRPRSALTRGAAAGWIVTVVVFILALAGSARSASAATGASPATPAASVRTTNAATTDAAGTATDATSTDSTGADATGAASTGADATGADATGAASTGAASSGPAAPAAPSVPATPSAHTGSGQVTINLGNAVSKPSESLDIIIALTLLSVAPALLIMMTSFTRVIIVLSLTRQALGLSTTPPNSVLAGLALFISLFIMSPVITQINHDAVQPYLKGTISQDAAIKAGQAPLRTWMLKQTRTSELAVFVDNTQGPKPSNPDNVPMTTLIPAFILSELKTAFIIGFVIFIPFLVIDLIVSSSLMSMGMMMLPPVLVSLPFKILLFVLVDGWALVVKSLITSYR
jgi:flagellar biosynthetic protein FliP